MVIHDVTINTSSSSAVAPKTSSLSPATLPCGLALPNRLVKASTYEHLASFSGGLPNASHRSLYSRWAEGGWGMIVTGNVQVSRDHLTLGRDMILPSSLEDTSGIAAFRALERALRPSSSDECGRPLAIMQLSHAGRQSPFMLGGRLPFTPPSAPSAVRLGHGTHNDGWLARAIYRLMFPTPHELSTNEVDGIVDRFVLGAQVALASGFDGVELHAAHGCALICHK
jgi:2,4-dienoyl-CoA reductase-like NADH-dependent reductase (Old Yellow Enzyme family)